MKGQPDLGGWALPGRSPITRMSEGTFETMFDQLKSEGTFEEVLDRLFRGDEVAARVVFATFEPYLHMVVRRHLPTRLRTKLDSTDIVQSMWVDFLARYRTSGWRFASVAQLRSFLARLVHDRVVDKARHFNTAMDREHPLEDWAEGEAASSRDPQPIEVVQADELWERMLSLCPTAHLDLLLLKRQGLSPAEIAARTGLHDSSVRRILAEVARRLAMARGC